jgi:hypothetical protein
LLVQDDDAMSADENAGGSEAGSGSGFVVDDGYLSQEEGVSLENDENIEPLDADMLGEWQHMRSVTSAYCSDATLDGGGTCANDWAPATYKKGYGGIGVCALGHRGTPHLCISAVLNAAEPAAGMDHDEAAAADRWRKANLLSGAIARAAKSNKPLIISALQA